MITPPEAQFTPVAKISRGDWQEFNVDFAHRDAAYEASEAFHMQPETVGIWHGNVAINALHLIANQSGARADDDNHLPRLQSSAHWNDLVKGGLDKEKSELILDDDNVRDYLHYRAREVIKIATEFRDEYPKTAKIFMEGIKIGRQLGFVPEEVTDARISGAVYTVGALVKDGALMELEEDRAVLGTYSPYEDIITLASDGNRIKATTIHELRHRIAGGTFLYNTHDDDPFRLTPPSVERTRTGFQERSRHRAIDEALTEHTTLAILNGNWDILNPGERDDSGSYQNERTALADLIKKSGGIIKLETLSKASFEDTGPEGSTFLRRQMMREIRRAYGAGALRKFDRVVDELNSRMKITSDTSQFDAVLNYIQAPEFDSDGNMTKRGRIEEPEPLKVAA